MRRAWLPLLLTACDPLGPFEFNKGPADADYTALVVTPAELDFGSVSALDPGAASLDFTITNAGDDVIPVHDHDIVESAAPGVFTVSTDEAIFQLAPGESREFTVSFAPQTASSYAGRISLNDGAEIVRVKGVGSAPVIALSADKPDPLPLGCDAPFTARIENDGDEPLTLAEGGVSIVDSADFAVLDAPGVQTLAPGESVTIDLLFQPHYDPYAGNPREGRLLVRSDDPATPEADLLLSVLAYSGSAITDAFTYRPVQEVDLLLAVDTGGIMDAHLQKAEDALYTLAESFADTNLDVNVAIVTGGSACPTTTRPFLDSAATASEVVEHLEEGLAGPSGSGSEHLLLHAAESLNQAAPGGCLQGFLREGALLHVLVIAGDDDHSGQSAEDQLANLRTRSPQAASHVVSAIVATDVGGCQGAAYGALYADAAVLTDGEIGDLCASAWDEPFAGVARQSAQYEGGGLTYALEFAPLLESLAVEVDGVTFPGWAYDATANALVFPAEGAPNPGSAVLISYLEAIACF